MKTNLTTKERLLLEDQKSHEEICVEKYTNYSDMATDPQLKDLFKNLAQKEQEHLKTINQLLNGQIPAMNSQQGGGKANQQQMQQQNSNTQGNSFYNKTADKNLCADMLMTEKYVSGTYDIAIFEFQDPQIRDILNHIQKEEQQHGEAIFKYMQSKGMYTPK